MSTFSLDPDQQAAVDATGEPILLVSRAGSGKTGVLTERIRRHIRRDGIRPARVLAITYTTHAAAEMRRRLDDEFATQGEDAHIETAHAFGARIIRANPESFEVEPGFTIIDDADRRGLLELCRDDIRPRSRISVDEIDPIIQTVKASLEGTAFWSRIEDHYAHERNLAAYDDIRLVADLYEQRLATANSLDFADLLSLTAQGLERHPRLLEDWQASYDAVLFDEYQDTTGAMERLSRLLGQCDRLARNLFATGDDGQSIYGFNSARLANMLEFESYWTERGYQPHILALSRNYRSTGHIVAAASSLLDRNRHQMHVPATSMRDAGTKPEVLAYDSAEDEIDGIVRHVKDAIADRQHVAVLTRSHAPLPKIEHALAAAGVTCDYAASQSLARRPEVGNALAFLRLVENPKDDAAFRRVLCALHGTRRIQDLLDDVWDRARRERIPQFEAAYEIDDRERSRRTKPLYDLITLVRSALERLERNPSPLALYDYLMAESGYIAQLKRRRSGPSGHAIDSEIHTLEVELPRFIGAAPDIGTLLHRTALSRGAALHEGYVTLMTLHAAKGLQFDHVILPGWEELNLPGREAVAGDESALEEDRRLAYVGITRARDRVTITYSAYRFNKPQSPSRFLEEIAGEHMVRRDRMPASAVPFE